MERRGASPEVRFSRQAKIIVLIAGAVLTAWLLLRVQRVLGPFVWGAIIAYVFSPLVDWLEARTRLRRIWVVVLLYLVGLAAAAWAATGLIPLVIRQASGLLGDMPGILTGLLNKLAFLDQTQLAERLRTYGITIDPQVFVTEAVRSIQNLVTYVTSHAIPAVFNVLEGVAQILLCLIVSFYLLRAWQGLRLRLPRLIPRHYRWEVLALLRDIDKVLGAYIRGQLLLIGIMALATCIALSILRVRYALVIGLISGVLEVIPLFGPILAGGIAVSVALFQPSTPFGWSNLTLALSVAVAYTVLRQIEDQLVVPNLVGPIVDLHPLLVLFALFAGGRLAGFTGLIIAVPAAAAIKIIATYLYGKIWDEPPAEDQAPSVPTPALANAPSPSGEES